MPIEGSSMMKNRFSSYIPIFGIESRNDTTPPMTTVTLDPSEPIWNGWYGSTVTVTLNATDNQSGVNATYYRLNEGEWETYTHSIWIVEEITIVEFYSIDNAGNEEVPKQVDIKIDESPPMITCSLNPSVPNGKNGWYISNITVTVNATDYLSGVKWTTYDGHNYTGPFSFNITEDFHGAVIKSMDNVGNIEAIGIPPLQIDTTPPTLVLNKEIKLNKIIYTATATDVMSGVAKVEFYLNDVLQVTENGSGPIFEWTLTPIPHTNEIVKAVAYDEAGNSASSSANTTNIYGQSQQQINPQVVNPLLSYQQINQQITRLLQYLILPQHMITNK